MTAMQWRAASFTPAQKIAGLHRSDGCRMSMTVYIESSAGPAELGMLAHHGTKP